MYITYWDIWMWIYYERTVEIMKIGRNDLCPCGSGKKYKKCCYPKTFEDKGNLKEYNTEYDYDYKDEDEDEVWTSTIINSQSLFPMNIKFWESAF